MIEDNEKVLCTETGKVCYSRRKAGEMLHYLRSRRHSAKRNKIVPVRYYFCPFCRTWHLTSQVKKNL